LEIPEIHVTVEARHICTRLSDVSRTVSVNSVALEHTIEATAGIIISGYERLKRFAQAYIYYFLIGLPDIVAIT
jgi:hypothetical protein